MQWKRPRPRTSRAPLLLDEGQKIEIAFASRLSMSTVQRWAKGDDAKPPVTDATAMHLEETMAKLGIRQRREAG